MPKIVIPDDAPPQMKLGAMVASFRVSRLFLMSPSRPKPRSSPELMWKDGGRRWCKEQVDFPSSMRTGLLGPREQRQDGRRC